MSTDSSIAFEEAPINFNDDDGLGGKLDDARQQAIERLNALPFSETPPLCLYTLDALREYLRNKTHVGAIISQSCDDEPESVGKAILIKAIADNFIQTLIAVAARNPNFALQGINDRTRGNDYIPRDSRLRAKTIRYDATWRSEDVLVLEIQRKRPLGGIDTDAFTWQQILFNEAQIKAMFPLAGVGEKAKDKGGAPTRQKDVEWLFLNNPHYHDLTDAQVADFGSKILKKARKKGVSDKTVKRWRPATEKPLEQHTA